MVRPPRSTETLDAQKSIDKARELLGSPSQPPDEFDPGEELTSPGGHFRQAEPTTHGGRKSSLPDMVVGEINEQAEKFKDQGKRLVWLIFAWSLVAGVVILMLAKGWLKLSLGQ